MKSAEQFLANLHRGISTPAVLTHFNILPQEVEFAASRGLKLAPVQGLSRFASGARRSLGYPTADVVQLRAFTAEIPVAMNWMMAVDNLIVLEYTPAIGHHSLRELCDGDWDDWSETLQFTAGPGSNATRFLLFRHGSQKLRALGPRSAGLRVHSSGAMIPAPPSRLLNGSRLAWSNVVAIQDIPWFLVASDRDFNGDFQTESQPENLPHFHTAPTHTQMFCNRGL
jgi:hypothetical protein